MRFSQLLLITASLMSAEACLANALAESTASPTIITSVSRTVIMSTGNMPPGSDMWAVWVSLPPGKRNEVSESKAHGTWMDLEITITGSTVSALLQGIAPKNHCLLLGDQGPVAFTGQKIILRQGDGFACDFGVGGPYWEENQGTELYSRAQLSIGGPWRPGMYDIVDSYRSVGGDSKAMKVDANSFRAVEKELRAAGAMIATTRIVYMPPGSTSLAQDFYPTLRMLTRGEIQWGAGSIDPNTSKVKAVFNLPPFNWIEWTKPQQVLLSNESDKPAELIEWSIAPTKASDP